MVKTKCCPNLKIIRIIMIAKSENIISIKIDTNFSRLIILGPFTRRTVQDNKTNSDCYYIYYFIYKITNIKNL